MFISVIVCTYNREKYVYNLLESIAVGTYPHEGYEIVLVDNNCTDGTAAECDRFAASFPEVCFRRVVETEQGLSHARNRGIAEARGDLLIYVDDDATVSAGYLQAYASFFESHPDVWAAGGPVIPMYETEEPEWISHYTKILVTGYLYEGTQPHPFKRGRYPTGCNAAYRKEVFAVTGLFRTDLGRKGNSLAGAEEKDLFDRMTQAGMVFHYLPDAVLNHIISAKKLTRDYFDRLTLGIGQSERVRTLNVSRTKYVRRLADEVVKWCGTLVLAAGFLLKGQSTKGKMLMIFRRNVTKGLLGRGGA